MDSSESVEAFSSDKKDLYSGFGNALSLGFEFVAIVGILFFVGHLIGGLVGGGVGATIGWIGAMLRLYYQFQPELPVTKREPVDR